MLGPLHRVVRPLDWTGSAVVVASWLVAGLGLLIALLVALPSRWVAAAFDSPELVRLSLALLVVLTVALVRPFVVAPLPGAVVLSWRTLRFRSDARRRRIALEDIARAELAVRPPPVFEAVVIVLHDGRTLEVCPLDWPGAPQLLRSLVARVGRRRRPTPGADAPAASLGDRPA